jgi:hypothetical protein
MTKRKWKDIIKVQPMNWQVFIVRPSSLADFSQFRLDLGDDPVEVVEDNASWDYCLRSGGAMFCCRGPNYVMVIHDEWDHETTYHEALHCASRLWHDAGADLKLPRNDEVLTYTQGHIVRLLIEKFYKEQKHAGTKSQRRVQVGQHRQGVPDEVPGRETGASHRGKQTRWG